MTATSPLISLVAEALVGVPDAAPDEAELRLAEAVATVTEGLLGARAHAIDLALPAPAVRGHLFRPLAALAGARVTGAEPDGQLWLAALAIQLAHEASLLHDDVIDGAALRRGDPTVVGREGVARALVEGDHLLTAAYRIAAETGSAAFMRLFAVSVERTVAGEKQQATARGSAVDWERYRDIVGGKSGELFACALAASAALSGGAQDRLRRLGRQLGSIYQMVDDFLDYCPATDTGKPALGDYRSGLWTWIRLEAPSLRADLAEADVRRTLFRPLGGDSPMRAALTRLRGEMDAVASDLEALGPDGGIVATLFDAWHNRAAEAAWREERALADAEAATRIQALSGSRALADAADWRSYFAEHGRTFRLAARLFPPEARDRVAAVYAFCRLTDDLVDQQADLSPEVRHRLLDAWRDAAWEAYDHGHTGIPLLDVAMGDMAAHDVPFRYAADLIAGARMDLGSVAFQTTDDLRLYTYRVASVVGLWLTELFGVHDAAVLDRAAAMGHAMQLTNILRDVGEDLARGRLYLPASLLHARGLTPAVLDALRRTDTPIPSAYAGVCEELMELAERQYAYAFEALPALPGFFRRPVAVAARAYAGIHDAVRRNGYDNLRRRAYTSLPQKVMLGAQGLRDLYAARQQRALDGLRGIITAS